MAFGLTEGEEVPSDADEGVAAEEDDPIKRELQDEKDSRIVGAS